MPDNEYLKMLLAGKTPAASSSLNPDDDARVEKYSAQNGVDPDLVRRMVGKESQGKRNAHSWAGAGGLMQLMPETARGLGVADVNDPDQNIEAGTRYLRQHLDKFNGDVPSALAAYNAGAGAVQQHGLDRVRK